MTIKLLVPNMPSADELLPYLRKIDANRWYTNGGPLVQDLEERLSQHYGGAYVVTVANCTLGLELVWSCLRREGGGIKAILPSLTFPATALAAMRAGLAVEFCDVDPDTWTSPWVSGFGYPEVGSPLDAAGAFGEQRVERHQTAVFSLHATKPLGAGEGGYIVTWDRHEAETYRRMACFGMRDGSAMTEGTNAKMSEYHAAVALAALDRWDRAPWLALHDWYDENLPAEVKLQKRPRGVYSLMPVLLPCAAQPVLERLRERGIETRRYYCPPLHRQPAFARCSTWNMPVTDMLADRLLCLPYHTSMTPFAVATVCRELSEAVRLTEPADPLLVREEEGAAA